MPPMRGTKRTVAKMIRIVRRITATAVWDIDGNEVTLAYIKEYPEGVTADKIKAYLNCLKSRFYKSDNKELCDAFVFFGGIAFIGIGMTSKDDLLECFTNYAKEFAKDWAMSNKCLKSKFIGYEYVFRKMLQNDSTPIVYDFRYILDQVKDSAMFCNINEQVFAEYWTKEMLLRMRKGESLCQIAKRVGDVRLSKYFMQISPQTTSYLKALANKYTKQ